MNVLSYNEFFITNFLFFFIKHQLFLNRFLSFSNFVYLCLYTYKFGYYENNLQKFGCRGDFITAAEIGKIFSLCIVRLISQINFYCKNFYIIEIGAGSGNLARNIILSLNEFGIVFSGYIIFEKSSYLTNVQKEILKNFITKFNIHWYNKLYTHSINGVVLLNEVFDSLPNNCFFVKRFIFYERCVSFSKCYGFYFSLQKVTLFSKIFFFDFFFFF